jgi:hypothetical protein
MVEFAIRPEVAGGLGLSTILDATKHPPVVTRLHFEFAGWEGDDIVGTFLCALVTDALAAAITDEGLTGADLDDVTVSNDPQFERFFPEQAAALPKWRWLKPIGRPHASDFWQDEHGILIVSERALDLIRRFRADHCRISDA